MMLKSLLCVMLAMTLLSVSARGARRRGCGRQTGKCSKQQKVMLRFGEAKPLSTWLPGNAGYSNRSISPWVYRKDVDPDRYPATISMAQCIHTHCVTARGHLDLGLNSLLVQQEMVVLRRQRRGHKLIYLVDKMVVPIACVCVRPQVDLA